MSRTIGIDLGTTNSVVAFIEGDRAESITNPEGSKLTPSVVFYKGDEEIIVGELAKRQLLLEPERCIRSVKRIVGKRFVELGEEAEDLPFHTVELDDGMAGVEIGGGALMRPEEVSADILERLRLTAEEFLGEEVTSAVITVPAHFNDQQRTATKAAAEMAGLEVQRVINEPTAAALAYGVGTADSAGTVAVFDFGGGTFDISILQISNDIFEVLSTNGDNRLGGDDVDHIIFQEICDGILQSTGIDPTLDSKAVQRIREAAEKTKCELSTMKETTISLPFVVADSTGPKHFEMSLTRDRFEEMITPILERLFEPCRRALADANLTINNINEVLLVGGSSRIPKVQQLVAEFFGREPNRSINPDEAVALGAAIQAGVMTGALREVLLLDVTPLTLGLELAGGVFKELITRNSTIPCEASRKFTTVVDNQASVVVHVLQGERKKASENHSLAKFRLVGIPPAPKELPEIEVKFNIDANGILSVTAIDLSTGQQTGVVVENYGEIGQRRDIVDRLVQTASTHLDEDERFMRFAERRQKAERVQDRANKLIEGLGDLVTEADLRILKESMIRLDFAMEAMDERTMSELEEKIREVCELYEANEELARVLSRKLEESRQRSVESGVISQDEEGSSEAVKQQRTQEGLADASPEIDDDFEHAGEAVGEDEEAQAPPAPQAPAPKAPPKPSGLPWKPRPRAASPVLQPGVTAAKADEDEESIRMPDSADQISAMYEVPTFDEDEDEDSSFDPSRLPPPQ
ncbi:MAG: molecular chaperone DnaK [Candidatus Sumerlaeota bacterium]|nr:molecular chaperone DnaK [Candidatus Sumerlaeota bacterium]